MLPFATETFNNIVMLDVLHHIPDVRCFFAEAARVLRPGGRVIMIEPEVTPISRLIYTLFHPELIDLNVDPLKYGPAPGTYRDVNYPGNQAIPHLLFRRHRGRFESEFADLRIIHTENLSLFTYPLTGGFRPWSLIPAFSLRPLLERREIEPAHRRL
jgi:SAM-dependent methyltransferase